MAASCAKQIMSAGLLGEQYRICRSVGPSTLPGGISIIDQLVLYIENDPTNISEINRVQPSTPSNSNKDRSEHGIEGFFAGSRTK